MTGEGAQTAQIRMEQYNDTSDAPDVRTRRYRGTVASPSAIQSGDYLFRSNHEYYNGTSLIVGGSFAFDNTNNAARTQFSVAVDTDGTGADPAGNNGQFKIDGNDSGAITFNNAYKFPTSDGSANQVLQTDGSGTLSFATAAGGLSDVVDDTTPQLGGNLDLNSSDITGTGDINITGTVTSDGLTVDTDTLHVDATNNRVGIGTSSPSHELDIQESSPTVRILQNDTGTQTSSLKIHGNRTGTGGSVTSLEFINTEGASVGTETSVNSIQTWYESAGNQNFRFKAGASEVMRVEPDGDLHADGDVIAYSTTTSDVRLKSDVEPITNALSKVNQLSGYTFTRNHNKQKSAGILAHELEKVLPEAVREKELPLQQNDGEKYKVVEYDAIHGLLIEAIKELSDKVKYLEERLEIEDGLGNK